MLKRCHKCGEHKAPSLFSVDKSRADGLQPRCKACYSEYKKSRRKPSREKQTEDEKKEKLRAWREANRDKLTRQAAEWRRRNPEKFAASASKFRAEKGEQMRSVRKDWSTKNDEKIREQNQAYRLANAGRYAEHTQRRNASKKRATPAWSDVEAMRKMYEDAARITRDTGVPHEVDHIVPLTSTRVCGLHCQFNLRVIPALENASKGNRYWPDMP